MSEDDDDFDWAAPTDEPDKRRRTDWKRVAEKLREHPGKWARMKGTFSHSVPGFIQSARTQAFRPAGSFEATMHGATKDGSRGRGRLYLRYVGDAVDFEWEDPPEED